MVHAKRMNPLLILLGYIFWTVVRFMESKLKITTTFVIGSRKSKIMKNVVLSDTRRLTG